MPDHPSAAELVRHQPRSRHYRPLELRGLTRRRASPGEAVAAGGRGGWKERPAPSRSTSSSSSGRHPRQHRVFTAASQLQQGGRFGSPGLREGSAGGRAVAEGDLQGPGPGRPPGRCALQRKRGRDARPPSPGQVQQGTVGFVCCHALRMPVLLRLPAPRRWPQSSDGIRQSARPRHREPSLASGYLLVERIYVPFRPRVALTAVTSAHAGTPLAFHRQC